jgi:sugar/nucleoside kinase (ribokinase family)
MTRNYDCIVAGSCVVDLLNRPADLDKPIGRGVLHEVEPLVITGGGITSNSGITMARMGMKIGIFSYVGNDAMAPVVRDLYRSEGIDDKPLLVHPTEATSTTVVMIDPGGERSFYHCVGAPRTLNKQAFVDNLRLFEDARMMLLGYYSLMPSIGDDLPEVLAMVRDVGCRTALDAAGAGGTMQPLDRALPHLDVYVPSHNEAIHQTGKEDPKQIIDIYRDCGAPGLLGVKLGKDGVMLSPKAGAYIDVPICTPPGDVVDTTGAGDSFYGGLLTGLLKELPLDQAGRIGTAAAACCVTTIGGSGGGRDYAFTAKLAGLE